MATAMDSAAPWHCGRIRKSMQARHASPFKLERWIRMTGVVTSQPAKRSHGTVVPSLRTILLFSPRSMSARSACGEWMRWGRHREGAAEVGRGEGIGVRDCSPTTAFSARTNSAYPNSQQQGSTAAT